MSKTERIYIRLTKQEKQQIEQKAKEQNLSVSEHVIQTATSGTVPEHIQTVQSCLVVNTVMNIINSYDRIPQKIRKEIEKELNQYVKY